MCRPQFKNLWFLRLRHTECACYFLAFGFWGYGTRSVPATFLHLFSGLRHTECACYFLARCVCYIPAIKKLRRRTSTEFRFAILGRVKNTHSQNYLAGGRMTESITWITPLEASISVARILASFTNAPLSVTVIFTGAPLTVFAALAATASSE